MASIFTYQEEPPRVHSPWSTPGQSTPQPGGTPAIQHAPDGSYFTSITKLEPERQDGPTEYKLHLLLRSRRMGLSPAHAHVSGVRSTPSLGASLDASGHLNATPPSVHLQASSYSRQTRLQQLTTQLLWRLQQSSPFHSSSNASLVLPVLPEATPRLGVPDRPAKLLPGLEESQGALYEIGVADDGTLVGLVDDELEESLTNLRAMAASLGCVVDVLRRVLVSQHGHGSVSEDTAKLWVAEVLVRPDTGSKQPPLGDTAVPIEFSRLTEETGISTAIVCEPGEQMRVAITGASAAGKSSLVGTLTTSTLDNGRGKSRLSLLKHRHEIASGITSSVAQELIGYSDQNLGQHKVVNYASGDVSSWPDIHNLSKRLVFLSDSPGLSRYAKSTFRTLVSWKPHWTLFCVAADAEDSGSSSSPSRASPSGVSASSTASDPLDLSLAHLVISLKMNLRLAIVVTKMDIATKTGLKTMLAKVLSILKNAGRMPVLLSAPADTVDSTDELSIVASQLPRMTDTERRQVDACLTSIAKESLLQQNCVPIVLTSAVTGAGFGKLHELLRKLPMHADDDGDTVQKGPLLAMRASIFHVDETFAIPPSKVYLADRANQSADRGIVLCGHVGRGTLSVGDRLRLGPFWLDQDPVVGEHSNDSPRDQGISIDDGRRVLSRSFPSEFSKSLQGEKIKLPETVQDEHVSSFIDVLVVSLRSLRLPVRSMNVGETGTVGIQPMQPASPILLSRARKGMILTSIPTENLTGFRSFTATFTAFDFSGLNSPPLILGGHAIIYLNSVRAAVRVTAVKLGDRRAEEASSSAEVFDFDNEALDETSEAFANEIHISFKFVSSIEWLDEGTQVLVVPNVTAAGPISGPPSTAVTGVSGFVGTVTEVCT